MPVVELSLDLGRRPVGLVPQGRDGSLLVNLGSVQAEDGTGEGDALFFDALHRKWRLVRIGERGRSTNAPDRRTAAEVPWSFGVLPDGGVHPAGLHSTDRWSPRRLEVDPRTGFLSLLDLQGRRSNLHRLYSRRSRRRSSVERSLALEVLSAERTPDGALPSVRPGERFAVEWVPIASLERRENWLFVSIETPGVSLAIR